MSKQAWWGFDIDKTAFVDDGGNKARGGVIGEPIMPIIRRIKYFLRTGRKVSIVTARVHPSEPDRDEQVLTVSRALDTVLGPEMACQIDIRSDKDRHMIDLYDDRAKQVIPNKGVLVQNELRRAVVALQAIAGSGRGEPYGTHAALAAREALDSLDQWSLDLVSANES